MLQPFFPHTSMHIEHFEKGMLYTDKQLILVARKIGKLATLCKRLKDESSRIRIETERRETKKDRDAIKVMVTVELPGKTLRAESRRDHVIEAVDRCVEKLEAPLLRYKEQRTARGIHRHRRSA